MGLKFLEQDERVAYIADALEQYRQAGIGLHKDLYKKGRRPALLVIDLQLAYTSPESPSGGKGASQEAARGIDQAVESTRLLLDAMRAKAFPIVFVTRVHSEDGNDGGPMGERSPNLLKYLKRGSRWAAIDGRVAPGEGEYIVEKKVSSGFIGTPLLQILTHNRVDTCIVAGLSISGCVRAAVVDAVSHGFYGVVPEEAVGDRSVGAGKASLFDIMTKYADVASLNDVLDWVNQVS